MFSPLTPMVQRATSELHHDGQWPPTGDHLTIRRKSWRVRPPRKPQKQLAENQVTFPATTGVLNPHAGWRVKWDLVLLALILYVLIVTPFELSFVSEFPVEKLGRPKTRVYRKHIALYSLNRIVDALFVVDLVMEFNTAFFDAKRGEWVVDHGKIAKRYAKSWLTLDVLGILPYDMLPGLTRRAGYLRLVRLVRLMKMLRVFKNPRIMARVGKRITLRAGTQAIIKYVLVLFLIFHWAACALRLIDEIILEGAEDCDRVGDATCPNVAITRWHVGVWGQYTSAVEFAVATLNSDMRSENLSEAIFSIGIGVVGCYTLAFLVGDLCNVITNLQPVRNDFRLTLDSLNDYLDEQHMPTETRTKLREYMIFSETVFRENYYRGLLSRLSPGLKLVVAQFTLSRVVKGLPFFQYALTNTACPMRANRTRVIVQPPSPGTRGYRAAVVTSFGSDLLAFDLRYDDTGELETKVSADRLGLLEEDGSRTSILRPERKLAAILHERDEFVVTLASMLETQLFMPRDTIVHASLSLNTHMYVVHSGRCLVFGRNSVREVLTSIEIKGIDEVIGDDICMLTVGPKRPIPRHYTAIVAALTQVHVLSGRRFVDVVNSGSFPIFAHHVRVYGCYQHVKRSIIRLARLDHMIDHEYKAAASSSSFPPAATAATAAGPAQNIIDAAESDHEDESSRFWPVPETPEVPPRFVSDPTSIIDALAFFIVHGLLAKPPDQRKAYLAAHPAIATHLKSLHDEIRRVGTPPPSILPSPPNNNCITTNNNNLVL
ncbi:hypothetical protein CTAYLR_005911 [Chrysophaeum taylorii]|uniref:Ion transport domain-containing protein n=1 Tax=Chrysophaeum taylorii TaxID=2483200 RepID=A0AAD7UJW4_9STRA|nr:hypothetical protein CTAYLR_005885 [Chrysophaeum taylorii]KAJ8614333.1 hypothetical protein CTAYLR_005911 [Chrysophaeum taylorii]